MMVEHFHFMRTRSISRLHRRLFLISHAVENFQTYRALLLLVNTWECSGAQAKPTFCSQSFWRGSFLQKPAFYTALPSQFPELTISEHTLTPAHVVLTEVPWRFFHLRPTRFARVGEFIFHGRERQRLLIRLLHR